MGGGIAEVAAKSGSDVLVWEAKQEFLDFGKAKIEKSLAKAVERGKLSEEDRDAALGRLTFTTDLEDFADRELSWRRSSRTRTSRRTSSPSSTPS